ncbi:MAG: hypothetical protein WDZ49_15620 [Litorilinea sp.]
MAHKKRIGLYLTPAQIVRNPDYLGILRDELGLNLVVLIFTGEFPANVLAHSPFDGTPPSADRVQSLLARHFDGKPSTDKLESALKSVGPHFSAGGDDKEVNAAIEIARKAGMEIWFMAGAWTASDYDVLMYNPALEANNVWYEAAYTHLATGYDVDGLDITHARFPMTSYPRGLLLGFGDESTQAATELGYDMAQMRADIQDAWDRLKTIDGTRLAAIAQHDMGPFDYMQLLGMRTGIIDWFRFRSDLLARNVKRFHTAVHAAAGADFLFGIDTYPASFSMFAGHNHIRWQEMSDYASPLLSHVDIFPMRTIVNSAKYLMELHPQLSEADALGIVHRFAGLDSIGMPESIAEFALGEPDCEFRHVPLEKLMRLDMAKARLYLGDDVPSYPIIQGGGAPHPWPREKIETIIADTFATGHDGYVFQGTSSLVDYELKKD